MRSLALAVALVAALVGPGAARNVTGYRGGQKQAIEVTDVDGKDVEIHTAKAFRAMKKAARKAGVHLAIRSGYRTHKKQAALYADYVHHRGNLAAKPGWSNHESGRALDLVVSDHDALKWLRAHASTYGFRATVPGERWHYEFVGS